MNGKIFVHRLKGQELNPRFTEKIVKYGAVSIIVWDAFLWRNERISIFRQMWENCGKYGSQMQAVTTNKNYVDFWKRVDTSTVMFC